MRSTNFVSEQEIRSVELGVCPMQLFNNFLSCDVLRVQNLLLCTKFHENPMIFTPRRVCVARTMPWQDVCPFVRPSHAGIVVRLPIPGSLTILVFAYQTGWQ